MTCPKCKFSFCFECLSKWEKGHSLKHEGGLIKTFTGFIEETFGCISKKKGPANKSTQKAKS